MAQYENIKTLVLPANIGKHVITTAFGSRGNKTTAGPGNEGIDLGIWIQEKIDDGTIVIGNTTNVTNLVTLTGLPTNSTDLGIFTGSIISDNTTIVNALQQLETYIESLSGGNGIYSGSNFIPTGTVATQSGTFAIDTTGVSGRTLQLGGITGVSTNRYGVSITHNQVSIGNVFGTQNQGSLVLNSSGFSAAGSSGNNLTLNSSGGGQLGLSSIFTIIDAGGNGGLRNNADYSAQFVDESLVTKRYVDSLTLNLTIGDGLIGDGTPGNPLEWAGGSVSAPLTGSGTAFFPFTVANNSITTTHIQNGTILFGDWAQNGATTGQVPSWSGSAWVPTTISGGGGGLPTGTSGNMLIHNGTSYISTSPTTETQSGLTGTSVTLAAVPLAFAPIMIFRNGVYQIITDDYTRSGNTLTLGAALVSTDKITAIYYI